MTGWVVVFTGPTFAAEVVLASLEAAGLRAEVMTDTGHLWPGANLADSRVFVPEDQEPAARNLIGDEFGEDPAGG
ncbi:MAG: hypothetical protein M3Z13_07950 [Candidatus Dormibacteraeota bacterium]|nr:hypothetical protein [Candidatus Dormibacteraeota bacterium]